MPNIKSAAKRVRITKKRTERNRRIKSTVRTAIRRFQEAMAGENREEAQMKLRRALVTIDKAVTKGVLHKNTAARKKSRLTKFFNKNMAS
ncbi:30S ribosomal protein S20 [Desulfoscipio geothermicus]|uniref:Small ribosomal subunit protein bS20 n=1 Tax=Desulfoscipio geothermicus DSM 3669 TaxID=1121426 RepID=A0A1I6D2Y7_9FIRM|nr:30S ribosomal protein S20 [Desulfoscipio geothermicus]SFQ99701.1 small subunit ribosomal protein S20 [Desulfoscipio geothermicus DSM 3669]